MSTANPHPGAAAATPPNAPTTRKERTQNAGWGSAEACLSPSLVSVHREDSTRVDLLPLPCLQRMGHTQKQALLHWWTQEEPWQPGQTMTRKCLLPVCRMWVRGRLCILPVGVEALGQANTPLTVHTLLPNITAAGQLRAATSL